MARPKAVTYFVAVSDLSKSVDEQEGILLEVEGKGGDSDKNRTKALEIITQMWEKGEIEADKFPDGITLDHIFHVPADSQKLPTSPDLPPEQLLPIIQGAQEIINLTKLQIEVQEAAEEAAPYVPIIEVVLERSRPLTTEEKDLAKDRKYGKVIERIGEAVANQEDYQSKCTGNAKLILNAIAWQLNISK